MTRRYRTVAREASAEIEVRRSRFIAYVARVDADETARAYIDSIRKKHWNARHNCSAFVLGPRGDVARSNDDGEPAGTAGSPMLEVIRGAGLSDVVVVVTRYFGGTLLGVGGLVRAYSQAVKAGLDEAGVCDRSLLRLWDLEVPITDAGRLENDLRSRGVVVREVSYGRTALLRLASEDDIAELVAGITAGSVVPADRGEAWVDVRRSG